MLEGIIRHGVVVAVAALVVCLLGAAAIFRVPVQMIPDMDITSLTVTTTWPGAAPQDVEREILIEQEEYLRSIPGLARMTAEATTGGATIELEFGLGRNLSEVLALTNNALSQVPRYPDNVDRPRIFTTAFSDNYFMFYVIQPAAGNPRGLDIEGQFDFVEDHVKAALERTPGVAEVKVEGGAERQLRVYVDPARLAQRRIRLSELRDALLARNQDMSGGDIDAGKRRYLVRTLGRFDGRRGRAGHHRRPARRHPGVPARSGADRTDARGAAHAFALWRRAGADGDGQEAARHQRGGGRAGRHGHRAAPAADASCRRPACRCT